MHTHRNATASLRVANDASANCTRRTVTGVSGLGRLASTRPLSETCERGLGFRSQLDTSALTCLRGSGGVHKQQAAAEGRRVHHAGRRRRRRRRVALWRTRRHAPPAVVTRQNVEEISQGSWACTRVGVLLQTHALEWDVT